MGKKIQYDQALKMAQTVKNDSIYAKPNPYGYRFNVNHPRILPLYEKYKDKAGERILSDQQRRHFEQLIFELIERRNTHE
jgi:hypothetical protein